MTSSEEQFLSTLQKSLSSCIVKIDGQLEFRCGPIGQKLQKYEFISHDILDVPLIVDSKHRTVMLSQKFTLSLMKEKNAEQVLLEKLNKGKFFN